MRILLDTHIFLWCVKGDRKLTKALQTRILSASEVYVSSASIWEASIKSKLGKLEVDIEELVQAISESNFLELPITSSHAAKIVQLPDIHRDPFDRMLIAQSLCEPLRLLTADALLCQYSDLVEVIK